MLFVLQGELVLCLLIFNRAWEEKMLEAQKSNSSLNVYCNFIPGRGTPI